MTKRNENEGRWEPFVGKSIVGKTTEPTDTNIYWLEKFLGRGSFGGVFLADQTQRMATVGGKRIEINKKIAIKLMAASDAAIHEVSSALTIPEHINLVRYFDANDVVIDEERLYVLTMELADGGSLRDLLGQGVLSGAETKAIAMNIAEGLSHLHSIVKTGSEDERWVHRDLKPENVLKVGKIWKIADFGTAKVLKKGTALASQEAGTLEYMPPEYFRDTYVSTKWDVWSFGVMIVEMLTGHLPFKGNRDELPSKIQREHPDLKGVPTEWMEVVKGCLQKEYTRRWTADELLTALDNIAFSGSKSSTGSVAPIKVKGGKAKAVSVTPPRSNNAWWIVGVLIVIGGGSFYLWQNPKALSFPPSLVASSAPSSKTDLPIPINDTKAAALYAQGEEKHSKKDYKGAIADFSEVIRLVPNYADAYVFRGGAKYNLEDKQGAFTDYNEAIQLNPNNAAAYLGRGVVKYDLGDKQGGLSDLNEAIRLDPKFAKAYYSRGHTKYDSGDNRGALSDYNEATRLDPKFANAYNSRGNAKKNLGDKQGALSDYSEAISLKPNDAYAYGNRGLVKNDLGDKQGAIADYNEAIRIKPDFADPYVNRGLVKFSLGDKQGASADYNEAIRLKPNSAYAYLNRGATKFDLGDKQGAIIDFNEAIRLKPDLTDAYHNRGLAKDDLGDRQGAIADYNEAIRIQPDYADPYFGRGAVKDVLGDKRGAIADYNEAIRLKPDYAAAYGNRGNLKSDLGDKQGAIGDYKETIRIKPDYAEAYYNLGNSYRDLGNKTEALANFRKAAELLKQQNNTDLYRDALTEIAKLER